MTTTSLEISVENVNKSFGDNHVLRGINLAVGRGELLAIVGGSGGGKSVLLHLMIGQMQLDAGIIRVADHESPGAPLVDLSTLDEAHMDRLRRHWAVVFQGNGLTSGTVEENIELPLQWVKGFNEEQARSAARKAIEAVGLNADAILPIQRDHLSGGSAKRVAIARALAMDPLVIFFDEPTTGLDPDNAKLIQDLIFDTYQRLNDGFRRTTLIVTHDKDLLYRIQPRVVMLHDGFVIFDGEYSEFAKSDSAVIRPYFEQMPILHERQAPVAGN